MFQCVNIRILKIMVFQDMNPYSAVDIYTRFCGASGEMYALCGEIPSVLKGSATGIFVICIPH
jgi:hypothetical protein